MKVFSRAKKSAPVEVQERSGYNPSWLQNLNSAFFASLKANGTAANSINEQEALTVSAVYSAVKLLSELPATLDVYVESLEGTNYYKPQPTHKISQLLANPNDFQTNFIFMQSMLMKMHLRGNSYALKLFKDNRWQLIPVYSDFVQILVSPQGDEIFYSINGQPFAADEIIHFRNLSLDGVVGLSPIFYAARTLNNAIDSEEYMNKVFESGIQASGFFTTSERLTKQAYQRLQDDIEKKSGMDRAGEAQILEQGLKFERNTLSATDSQIIESMQFNVEQVARIYRVPKHLLYLDAKGGSTRSFSTQAREFLTYTLTPIFSNIEEELEKKLLSSSEISKNTARIKFDTKALLRVDPKERVEYYGGLFNIGAITSNEARAEEGMPPVDGGDTPFVQLNLAPLDKIEAIITDKINKQIDSTNG